MLELLWKYGWLVAIGLQLVLGWIGWSARNAFATNKRLFQELKARDESLQQLTLRLIKAEAELEDKPTAKALHELALAISHFGGDLKALVARTDGLEGIVNRLEKVADRQEEFLLNGGPRR